jgi:hypothetical protein
VPRLSRKFVDSVLLETASLDEAELVPVLIFEPRPYPPRLLDGLLRELHAAAAQLLVSGLDLVACEDHVREGADPVLLLRRR